ETRSGHPAEIAIRKAGRVAVAALEAETDRPADGHTAEIRIGERGRRQDLGQNVHGCEGCRVVHQRQVDGSLYCAGPRGVPDVLVFASRVLVRRMRCPVDSGVAKIVESYGDGALAPTEGGVDVYPQARDGRSFDGRLGAIGELQQAPIGFRESASEELAFGH